MERKELFERAELMQAAAMDVAAQSGIIRHWEAAGATVNIVGSVKSGLIINNRDLDMHVYTDEPLLEKSFSVMAGFGKNPSVKEIHYGNLLDTEEECVEWHVRYEAADGTLWKMDIIHIRKGSTYDGVIERTTEAVIDLLTPEIKEAVLRIKYEKPEGIEIPGIQIYYAVIAQGATDYESFARWKNSAGDIDLLGWIPEKQ